MKSVQVLFSILFLFVATALVAQNKGKIAGKILDKAIGEDLIGATVQIEGANIGAVTDIEGKFILAVAPGTYTVVVSYISYRTEKIQAEVKADEVTFLNVALEESSSKLTEVTITYTVQKSSALALLTERKNAATVSDGVSAELIRRTPDRSTSDVLKRVTGASIQEGKFAVIRGMNDRYNAGYLDGALLPSTESDRKAFAFDVIPANLIDNLQIVKAGTPDVSGDFGGGIIKINTKAVPEKFTQSISIGGQTHSLTTFKSFSEAAKYSGESLGLVNSKRDLPNLAEGELKLANLFPTTEQKEQLAASSRPFNHDWSSTSKDAMPNTRFAYSLGLPIKLSDDRKLGILVALNYSNTRRFSENKINTFDGSGQTASLTDQSFLQNITSGGILNVNYVSGKTQISLRNLLNVNADFNTVQRAGMSDIVNGVEARTTANLISNNRLVNSAVSLKHVVGDNFLTIQANANYANVRRRIPDFRIVSYTKTPEDENFRLATGDFFNSSTGRFASDLNENLAGGQLEVSKSLDTRRFKTNVKVGTSFQQRNRDFYGRSFVYNGSIGQPTYDPAKDLSADNIAGNRLYIMEKTADDIGYYNGKQQVTAAYAMADQRFNEKFRALYGVRYENAMIDVSNEKIGTEIANIKQGVVLPSAHLTFALNDKMNLRGSYFASVNRPEFRELAPFSFYVFDKNAEIRGNQDLKIANLNNFDLRWEFFPSGSQVISAGAFYKKIQNPVEFNIDITQVFTTFTFENERSADIYGVEFEVRKNFDFLGDRQVWNDIVVFSNLALIRSSLSFEEGSQAAPDRPLQGQSPYVLNGGIQYESEQNGWFGSAVFNRIGRRIAFVGVDPQFGDTRQDIYEAPRTVVDLQVGKNFGKLNLKFTVGDVLRQKLTYYQDADKSGKFEKGGTDRQMFQFINGTTLSLTAGYTL